MAKDYSRLTISERRAIEQGLNCSKSLSEIARQLGRSASTIFREVDRNRVPYSGKGYKTLCRYKDTCEELRVCGKACVRPYTRCADCERRDCRDFCGDYIAHTACKRLEKPPHVCNGCGRLRRKCGRAQRTIYDAKRAESAARKLASESRSHVEMGREDFERTISLVRDAVDRGLSPYEICERYKDEVEISPSTLYRWFERGYGNLMSIELERKVRFRPRRKKHVRKSTSHSKRRSYDAFLTLAPEARERRCEMDTVIGRAVDRQVILTLYLAPCHLQLALLLKDKTCAEVRKALRALKAICDPELFFELFSIVLTDNGEEFANETGIGKILGETGCKDTRLFYCDPRQSQQKGSCEKNHTELRQILKKGLFVFDELDGRDLAVVMSHANSNPRRSLGGKSPIECFLFFHGKKGQALLDALGIEAIDKDRLMLKPNVLDVERTARGKEPLTHLK